MAGVFVKAETGESETAILWRRLYEPALFAAETKQDIWRYALAVLAAVAALALRKLLNPLFGSANPYHTAWVAVVFSAWYCGIGPSIVTVVISLLGVWYWFLPTYGSFAIASPTEVFGMLSFLTFSTVFILLGEYNRRIALKHRRAEAELIKAREKLETRDKTRTVILEQRDAELIEKAALLDMANDAIFVKSANGTISYWNEGATRLYGWTMTEAIGRAPAELLHSEYPIPLLEIESRDHWQGEILHTKRDGSRIVVASHWTALRDQTGKPIGWLESNTDVTYRKHAEDAARSLSARILILQDQERRRIARGLHDSLGQYLAALKMSLAPLLATDQKRLGMECSDIVDKCLSETRTISHLLHPPLLEEAGLASAVRWYVDGFAQRSGIEIKLELPSELGRLHGDLETALFRALQEALTNIHRHSDSSAVDVCLTVEAKQVRLEIKDNGKGIPPKTLKRLVDGLANQGVGLAGMRERMRELGGSLQITSNTNGTSLRVVIPISETQ